MSFISYPVKVEIWDDAGFHVATVTTEKSTESARIVFRMGVDDKEWPELSDCILDALKSCKL